MATQNKDAYKESKKVGRIAIILFAQQKALILQIHLEDSARGYLEKNYPDYYQEYFLGNSRKVNIFGLISEFRKKSQTIKITLYEYEDYKGIPRLVRFNHPEYVKNSALIIPLNLINNMY